MRKVLSADAMTAALQQIPQWTQDGTCIRRSYTFKDFDRAFGFMTQVALAAAKMDHHPDWCQRCNRVQISLTTHSAGGLTELDFALARRMDALFTHPA